MPLTARGLMTREMVTVTPATSLEEFARICAEDGISGAPVVDADGSLAGLITKLDLMAAATSDGGVEQIMRRNVPTVSPNTSLSEVAALMARERVHRVVVVSEKNGILGLLTSLDVLGRFPR